jgi:NAD(P)-dependent dehydrogenase (short-subunit alcohol dehydrogenase family)
VPSILITGASSGFGREVSLLLAENGWRVFAGMRDPAKREAGAALVAAAVDSPGSIEVIPIDVTSAASREAGVRRVLAAVDGRLDAVLHCAGYTTAAFFEDLPSERARDVLETNLVGAMEVTRLVLPAMRTAGKGRIAVVSSNAVNVPHPMYSVYAASKWALEGWCEALSMELRPFGIDVVVFQPGNHDTAFGSNVVPVLPPESPYAGLAAAALPKMARLGRYARSSLKASRRMSRVLESRRPPLRVRLGPDDHVAHWLSRLAPYEVRRRGVQLITGLGAGSPAPVREGVTRA